MIERRCSRLTNEEIVSEIQQGHDEKYNLERLFNQCKGLIIKTIVPYTRKGLEFDDLFQESFIATVNAAKCFKSDGGALFSTYLVSAVNRACVVYRWKQYPVHIPPHIQGRINKYFHLLADHQEADLTDEMLQSELEVNSDELAIIKQAASMAGMESIQQIMASDEDGCLTLEDTISDMNNLDDLIDDECDPEISGKIDAIINMELTDNEKKCIQDYFYKGIKSDLGIRTKNNALKKLRKSHRMKRLCGGCADYGSMFFKVSRNYLLSHCTSTTEMIALKRIEQEEMELIREQTIEKDFRKLKEDASRFHELMEQTLTEKRRKVMFQRYGQRLSQTEVAEINGTSKQAVADAEKLALKALGKNREIMSLADEMLELLTKYGVHAYDPDMIRLRNLLMKVVDSNE